MQEVKRISPLQTSEKIASGKALLVCAYESDDKFKHYQLDGAVSFQAFKSLLPTLGPDKEIIFYCN